MPSVGIVYLVRHKDGMDPFRQFVESYRENPGGVNHELILAFKGFPFRKIPDSYVELTSGIRLRTFFTVDYGFDIRPYFLCAREFHFPYFCFLNSFSVLLDKEWLKKLLDWGSRDSIGAAGATGSWESHFSNMIEGGECNPRILRKYESHYQPFPNPHLRTNAFLINRERFLSIRYGWMLTKNQAHRFESGRSGFTMQFLAKGFEPVVALRHRMCRKQESEDESEAFDRN